eukprot:4064731-Amphidinium_carterae.1
MTQAYRLEDCTRSCVATHFCTDITQTALSVRGRRPEAFREPRVGVKSASFWNPLCTLVVWLLRLSWKLKACKIESAPIWWHFHHEFVPRNRLCFPREAVVYSPAVWLITLVEEAR